MPPATVVGMSPRRLAVFALVASALLPGVTQAAVPVALYPLRVPGISATQRADIQELLKAALASGARRDVLRPRVPTLIAATCAEPPTAACLARLAEPGVLLVGRGERRGGIVVLTLALYDRNGARTREARFAVDLEIENLRPVYDALAQLESELDRDGTVAGAPKAPPEPKVVASAPKPPTTTAAPRAAPTLDAPRPAPAPAIAPKPAPLAAAPSAPARSIAAIPLPPPPAGLRLKTPTAAPTAAPTANPNPTATPTANSTRTATPTATPTAIAIANPAPLDVSAPAEPPPVWKRQAGPFFTIVGGLALASGGAVALANRSLANDLNAKRTAGTLSAADRASYDKVDRYNVLSTVLLAGGGISLAAGTWIWITAPARPGDPVVAVAGGRF